MFQKCELYWLQPKEKTESIKEEEEEDVDGETHRFGRFLLRVTDSHEKDGFTVTDVEIQVSFPSSQSYSEARSRNGRNTSELPTTGSCNHFPETMKFEFVQR